MLARFRVENIQCLMLDIWSISVGKYLGLGTLDYSTSFQFVARQPRSGAPLNSTEEIYWIFGFLNLNTPWVGVARCSTLCVQDRLFWSVFNISNPVRNVRPDIYTRIFVYCLYIFFIAVVIKIQSKIRSRYENHFRRSVPKLLACARHRQTKIDSQFGF